jgi:hypothetical protein
MSAKHGAAAKPSSSVKLPGSDVGVQMLGQRGRAMSLLSRSSTLVNLFADQELNKVLSSRSDGDDSQQSMLELVRLRVKFVMASSWGGQLYRNIFLLLSALSCFFFIAQTYYKYEDHLSARGKSVSSSLNLIELVLAGMFSFDWVLELFIAEHKADHLFSFFGIVDLITVIPTFLSQFAFPMRVSYDNVDSLYEILNYVNYGLHTVRILRALRVYKYLANVEDQVHRFLFQLGLTFMTMLLFGELVPAPFPLCYAVLCYAYIPIHNSMRVVMLFC